MKRLLFFLILQLITTSLSAQNLSIRGQVVDSVSNTGLIAANILLTRLPESTTRGTASDKEGRFIFENLRPGKYQLKISYIGYKTYITNFELGSSSIDFQKIKIAESTVLTDEVVVLDKLIPVVQKADTSEFNAAAFTTNKDASAEDLVAKMPGISVQDGKIKAQGEEVKKVLVDGRPFFGDDPNTVLRNVPAEIVERIQVFDQQSEQAQFTGFEDGNAQKTLNLVTRMRIRQGTFGRLSSGYGNESRYRASGNINLFDNEQRISVIAQTNNINEQNFSMEDLVGVFSGGGGPRGGMGGGMRPGGGGFGGQFFGEGPQFFIGAKNGLTKTHAVGVNYSDKFGEKLEVNGSYFLNYGNTNSESILNREYFLASNAGQNYRESSVSNSRNLNHRLNMRVEYEIDTLNSILFRPRISAQHNEGNGLTLGNTTSAMTPLNSLSNLYTSDLSALNANAELLYRHRFETRGRTISLSFNGSYNENNGNSKLLSESIYYYNILLSDSLDQFSDLLKDGYSASYNLTYTEPLGEESIIQFTSRYSYSQDESDKKTYDRLFAADAYTSLDTALSNVYLKKYKTQSYGTGYRWQKQDISLNLNLNYNISSLENSQSFPYSANLEKSFRSVLPSAMLRYNISRDRNLRFNYFTSNNSPSVDQLQNVVDNSNPVQLKTGNPELKQDYRHMLILRYSSLNYENLHSSFIMLGAAFTNNYIGNRTIIAQRDTVVNQIRLNRGMQITIPENMDGYINLRSFFSYGIPAAFIKSNVNFNLSVNYSRTPGIINSKSNFANSFNLGGGVVISSNFSKDLDFTISSNSTYNEIKNSVLKNSDNNYFNQNTYFKFYWMFWQGFFIQTELRHLYDSGLGEEYNRNSALWNLSIGKKFFSDERAELRLTAYDLLNQNSNIQRNVYDAYYEDTRSNTLGRYFMLSFVYNLRDFN